MRRAVCFSKEKRGREGGGKEGGRGREGREGNRKSFQKCQTSFYRMNKLTGKTLATTNIHTASPTYFIHVAVVVNMGEQET